MIKIINRRGRLLSNLALYLSLCCLVSSVAMAQNPRAVNADKGSSATAARSPGEIDDTYLKTICLHFYETYRLGPSDEIAIRVEGEPEYTMDRAKVTPTGHIYHPLLGEVDVAGKSIDSLKTYLIKDFEVYVRSPRVTVTLLESHSARFSVIGEVIRPGIFTMAGPTTLLQAIEEAGGATWYGKTS